MKHMSEYRDFSDLDEPGLQWAATESKEPRKRAAALAELLKRDRKFALDLAERQQKTAEQARRIAWVAVAVACASAIATIVTAVSNLSK